MKPAAILLPSGENARAVTSLEILLLASGNFAVPLMSGPSGNAWPEGTGTPKAGGATTDHVAKLTFHVR